MIQKMMTLLILLGLFSKTSCDFTLIQEPKSWKEAQMFCRSIDVDLATVQSDQDRSKIKEIANSMSFNMSWMGLYKDLNSWGWSFQNQNLEFQKWGQNEGPTAWKVWKCGLINKYGYWHSASCEDQKPFFCYTGKDSGDKFVFIDDQLTWRGAQDYCRKNYIDLATINDDSDNGKVYYLIQKYYYYGYDGWIGLSMNLWLWSDQSKVNWTSLKWASGEPVDGLGNEKCAFVQETGLIGDEQCSQRLPFFCAERSKMQLVRVAVKSDGRLDESAVKAAVETKIKKILKEQKMEAGSNVTWRVQRDGKIFHQHIKHDSGMIASLLPFCPNDYQDP